MINLKMFTRHLSLFYVVFSFSCCNGQPIIEFVEQPLPLLIPANEIGVFSCRARCLPNPCLGFWIINNLHSQDMHHRSQLELRGFAFTDTQQVMDEYKLTLTVNVSEAANSSMIACEYSMTGVNRLTSRSMAAELLVISSSPISPNPKLVKNATHISLLWSPPFLWPGHRINYYNVSLTYNSYRSVTSYLLNSTFSTKVATLTWEIRSLTCTSTQILFSLSSINFNPSLQVFNITEQLLPLAPKFSSSAVNINILFEADGTPRWVLAVIQLPELCGDEQEYNYTLIIESQEGDLVTLLGSKPHLGSRLVREIIEVNMSQRQNYSLRVSVVNNLQSLTSDRQYFSTAFHSESSTPIDAAGTPCDATDVLITAESDSTILLYRFGVGVCISVALASVFTLIVVLILCLCAQHKRTYREKLVRDIRRGMCDAMVDNPIYVEGNSEVPIYDTVHCKGTTSDAQIGRHYEALMPDPRSCTSSTDIDSNTTLTTDRYVSQPTTQYQSFTKLVADTLAESTLKVIDSENVQDTAASPGPNCEHSIIMRTGLTSDSAINSQATATCYSGVVLPQDRGKLQRALELSPGLDGSSSCVTDGESLSPNVIDVAIASSSDNELNTPMNPAGVKI